MTDVLTSWNDGATRNAIVAFVERTVADGVPPEERVTVFDDDGTWWCERPLPIHADFILRRLYEMAETDADLRDRQPWKAAYERDYGWLHGKVLAEHYAGDESNVRTLLAGVLAAFAGISVEDFERSQTRSCAPCSIRRSDAPISNARTRRWSSCSATWRRMGSRTTSPRVAPGLHAAGQPGGVRHSARAGDRQRN